MRAQGRQFSGQMLLEFFPPGLEHLGHGLLEFVLRRDTAVQPGENPPHAAHRFQRVFVQGQVVGTPLGHPLQVMNGRQHVFEDAGLVEEVQPRRHVVGAHQADQFVAHALGRATGDEGGKGVDGRFRVLFQLEA